MINKIRTNGSLEDYDPQGTHLNTLYSVEDSNNMLYNGELINGSNVSITDNSGLGKLNISFPATISKINSEYTAEPEFDEEEDEWLYNLDTENTALLNYLLTLPTGYSPKQDKHKYLKNYYLVQEDVNSTTQSTATVKLDSDSSLSAGSILIVRGVNGYDESGKNITVGKDLQLKVESNSGSSIVVSALNGSKQQEDSPRSIPPIPKGTQLIPIFYNMDNKGLAFDAIVAHQYKLRIPFNGLTGLDLEELVNLKKTLAKSFYINTGVKDTNVSVSSFEGIRWQAKTEFMIEDFTKETFDSIFNVHFLYNKQSDKAVFFVGAYLMSVISKFDNYQAIDNYKGVVKHTYGEVLVELDNTLNTIGYSNSGLILNPKAVDRAYHKVDNVTFLKKEYNTVPSDSIVVVGRGAIWVNGEGEGSTSDTLSIKIHDTKEAPTGAVDGDIFYLTCYCPGISKNARAGQLWQARMVTGSDLQQKLVWNEYLDTDFFN